MWAVQMQIFLLEYFSWHLIESLSVKLMDGSRVPVCSWSWRQDVSDHLSRQFQRTNALNEANPDTARRGDEHL